MGPKRRVALKKPKPPKMDTPAVERTQIRRGRAQSANVTAARSSIAPRAEKPPTRPQPAVATSTDEESGEQSDVSSATVHLSTRKKVVSQPPAKKGQRPVKRSATEPPTPQRGRPRERPPTPDSFPERSPAKRNRTPVKQKPKTKSSTLQRKSPRKRAPTPEESAERPAPSPLSPSPSPIRRIPGTISRSSAHSPQSSHGRGSQGSQETPKSRSQRENQGHGKISARKKISMTSPARPKAKTKLPKKPAKKSSTTTPSSKPNPRPSKISTMSTLPPEVFRARFRPPTMALKEIRYYQQTSHDLIPRLPFARLVREITTRLTNCDTIRYKGLAIECLQAAAEAYVIGMFEDSNLLALHAKRVTLFPRDMALAYRIRGDYN